MVRKFALAVGAIFLAVGVLGFVPGVTTPEGMLFGVFAVDAVHNLVHLIVGALGIAAYYWDRARLYCQALGIWYLVVGVLGFIPALLFGDGMLLGLFHVNVADNLLHLIVGAAAAYLGFAPQFRGRPVTPAH
ncbi:MAG: DUF4383 domain-containing protein [Actinomycetota bacterium]